MKDLGLIYLATTYRVNPGGLDKAFIEASVLAARMLGLGYKVFSPIAHTHPIAIHGGLDPKADFWLDYDEAMMVVCSSLVVSKMRHWEDSKGIAHEIDFFRRSSKPVYYMDPLTLVITP